jgi:putative redox protein
MTMRKAGKSKTVAETLVVGETGLGPFQVKVKTGSATFLADESIGGGGQGAGPDPYDLLSAAIGSCAVMTMRLYAARRQLPLDEIRVKVTHIHPRLRSRGIFVKEIEFVGNLNEVQRAQVVQISTCSPLHLALERAFDVKTVLLPDRGMDDTVVTYGNHARDMAASCDT